MSIWRMRISRWIHKATNTHSEYVIIFAFPLQKWLHEGASMLCNKLRKLPVFFLSILFISALGPIRRANQCLLGDLSLLQKRPESEAYH
jgi:hypothetical protein